MERKIVIEEKKITATNPADANPIITGSEVLVADEVLKGMVSAITILPVTNKVDWPSTGKKGKKEDNVVYKLQDLVVFLDGKPGFGKLLPGDGDYSTAEKFKD